MHLPWRQLQKLGAVALVALSAGFLALRCASSDDIAFVTQRNGAPWIMPPSEVSANLEQWGSEHVPVSSFRRIVYVDASVAEVVLRLRAFRGFDVRVNGTPVPGGRDDGARWRTEQRIDLTSALGVGPNEIEIDVANANGPALISLRIEGLAEPVISDGSWIVSQDGEILGKAVPADDTRRNPAALEPLPPARAIAEHRSTLLGLFSLGFISFLGWRRFAGGRAREMLPAVALSLACLAWSIAFLDNFVKIPIDVGFDAQHHLAYAIFLQKTLTVPLPTAGWSAYHPPLFYAGAAWFEWVGRAVGGPAGATFGLKLIPFFAGLGNVAVAAWLCRRLFPNGVRIRTVSVAFAAVLPVNLYASAYFSNETLLTLLAGLAILVTVDLLLAPVSSRRRILALGFLIGLALLVKYTAVLIAAASFFFVVCKLVSVERATPARVSVAAVYLAIPPLLLAGWFYARNALLFGDPLIANWGNMPGATVKWWQQPGFHTAAYYLHFGDALTHPYLSAFRSFWDSLYSTLWGDGMIAGRVYPSQRHVFWDYGFMSSTYLMALPACAFLLAGGVRCVVRAFSGDDPGRRAAFAFLATLAYAVLFGLLYMSLRLPFFGQAKATYGLIAMPAMVLFFADGLSWCDEALDARGWQVLRAAVYGWFVAFAATCFLSFTG